MLAANNIVVVSYLSCSLPLLISLWKYVFYYYNYLMETADAQIVYALDFNTETTHHIHNIH